MEYQWHYDLTLLYLSRCLLIFPVGHPPFGEFIDQPWRKRTRRCLWGVPPVNYVGSCVADMMLKAAWHGMCQADLAKYHLSQMEASRAWGVWISFFSEKSLHAWPEPDSHASGRLLADFPPATPDWRSGFSYPLVNYHNYGKSPCFMVNFTINGDFP